MDAVRRTARVAGLIYVVFVILGVFSLMYVSGKVAAKATPAETAANLFAHQTLIRIDLAVGLVTTLVFAVIAVLLYQLFKDVDRRLAILMAALVIIQLPQGFVLALMQLGALALAQGSGMLGVIDQPQRESLAMVCTHLSDKGLVLSEFFWGVWLLPLAVLVYRSGFLPRFIGVWLYINGVAYVAMSMMNLFAPQYTDAVFKFAFPAMLGELALTVALLVVGFRSRPLVRPA